MSETPVVHDKVVMLKNVRISYPKLFAATQYQGAGLYSYSAAFHIVPGSANDLAIRKAIAEQAVLFGKNAAVLQKSIEMNPMKYCYIDGAIKGLENVWVLTSKRKQEDGKPLVIDRDKTALTAESGRIYGGCFVNAKVEIYAQHKGGNAPGMRCGLMAVQFFSDGESFGGASVPTDAGFESVESAVEEFA